MNREEFINYLYNPQLLDKTSLEGIRGVLQRYPYFHTAHLLMVKNLKNTDDIHFAGQLNLSAAYAGDRDRMFKLVHDYLFSDKSTVSEKEKERGEVASPVENFTEDDTSEETVKSSGSDENREEEMAADEGSTAVPEEDKPAGGTSGEESLADRILREIQEYKRKKEGAGFADNEDLHVEEEGQLIKSDDGEEKAEAFAESAVQEDEPTSEDEGEVSKGKETDDLLEFDSGLLAEWGNEDGTAEEDSLSDGTYPFFKWLELLKPPETLWENKGFGKGKERSGSDDEADSGNEDDLIDRFLENKPRIEPREIPEDPGQEVDISGGSARESEELFTETLARIYIQQKHYQKAVYAYEKLSLKYPEKYSYFAKQIEEIKRIINQSH